MVARVLAIDLVLILRSDIDRGLIKFITDTGLFDFGYNSCLVLVFY